MMNTQTRIETIRMNVADLAIATMKTLIVFALLAVLIAGMGQV